VICGGSDDDKTFSNCFSLEGSSEWTSAASLITPRSFAAVSPSPYQSQSQRLFVTGIKKIVCNK